MSAVNKFDLSPKSSELDDECITYVITRTGKREPLSQDKITDRLKRLINREPKIKHVNPYELTKDVAEKLSNNITTYQIDEYVSDAAASKSVAEPAYMQLASRLVVDNHQKSTLRSFVDKMALAYFRKDDNGVITPLLSESFYKYVVHHQERLEKMIHYDRDFSNHYFGMRTFQEMYGIRVDGKVIERPQDLYMRTAAFIHMDTCLKFNEDGPYYDIEEEMALINKMYTAYSKKQITQASPTNFNAGTCYPALSSCFLMKMGDSEESIMQCMAKMARISKWSGGIGTHIHSIRSNGSLIRKTNGRSNGIVPFLRIANNTMLGFNQGGGKGKGKRNGSNAFYLIMSHPDIVAFLKLKLPHGAEEERARDLFYACWIPDLFMKRVEEGKIWSLFDPDQFGDLSDLHNEAFNKRYLELEEQKKYRSQINARQLWEYILISKQATGVPYLCGCDIVNRYNMQSNIGVIKSSNLCVTGDTLVLTDKGYFDIKTLSETNNRKHKVWNGKEFSLSTFAKTGTQKELMLIKLSDGTEIKCTPEHEFPLRSDIRNPEKYIKYKAKDLEEGHQIIKCEYPIIDNSSDDFKYPYTHGFFCGDGTYSISKEEPNQCMNKKIENEQFCKIHVNKGYQCDEDDTSNTCQGTANMKKPLLSLYHEKKNLLEYIDYYGTPMENIKQKRLTLFMYRDIAEKFTVPINYSKRIKLEWLAGYLDADGCVVKNGKHVGLQICSINEKFLKEVKLMLNTLGCNPSINLMNQNINSLMPGGKDGHKIYQRQPIYRMCISTSDTKQLLDLGLETHRLQIQVDIDSTNKKKYISIVSTEYLDEKEDTYCFNEPIRHLGVFNGVLLGNCSEITLYSDEKQIAVCNLGSISLPSCVHDRYSDEELKTPEEQRRKLDDEFPVNPYFDFNELLDHAKLHTIGLNNIIDKTFYAVEEAKASNLAHRPIGIGIQGLADAYIKMRFPFDSPQAKALNKKISEVIYYGALSQSTKCAKQLYKRHCQECKYMGKTKVTVHIAPRPDEPIITREVIYDDISKIPKNIGAYPSINWNGGGPISGNKSLSDFIKSEDVEKKPIFHWELYGLDPNTFEDNYKLDWESLREHIRIYGVRNSLLVALMPTASTSQFLGNNECFEPFTSNLYKRKTLAGEFIILNKYLVHELYELGLWNEKIKNYLILTGGSIQHIEGIPDQLKQLYKTAWEIHQSELVQQRIDAQPFVDQAMSFNLYSENLDLKTFNKIMFQAWKGGLKTWNYYWHTRPATMAQPFTIDPEKQNEIMEKIEKNKPVYLEIKQEVCDACSA